MTDHTALLSAFCDGEPVDPDALATALDDPSGRHALVDFARLRAVVNDPSEPLPASLSRLRARPSRFAMAIPLPAVAALVVLVLLGAWMLPRPSWIPVRSTDQQPPTPARVVQYTPGVDWQNR